MYPVGHSEFRQKLSVSNYPLIEYFVFLYIPGVILWFALILSPFFRKSDRLLPIVYAFSGSNTFDGKNKPLFNELL